MNLQMSGCKSNFVSEARVTDKLLNLLVGDAGIEPATSSV
jgi:hypothetical protein